MFSDFEENINDISINRKIKSDGGIGDRLTKIQLMEFKFLRSLSFIPASPGRFAGYAYKKGKILSHYNLRYIEINAVKNLFLRFMSKDDYPVKPKEVLSLRNIINFRKMKTSDEGKYYYIEIILKDTSHIFRFESLKTCNIWLDEMNKSLVYSKFWINLEKKYSDVQAFLCTIKQDTYEIDYLSGEVKKLELNQNKKESNKNLNIITKNNEQNNNNISITECSLLENSIVGINSFEILDTICQGNFGKLYKVKFKLTEEIFSMEALNKQNLAKNNKLKYAIDECKFYKQFVSPFIMTLYYSFQTSEYLYFVFDFCPGGDLNFHILHTLFEEEEAKFYIAEIILAIEYLHKLDITYKNFNFDNIFISEDNHIKLGGFDLIKEGNYFSKIQNNIENNSLRGKGKSSDIYGIGAILYEMVCGSVPFYSSNFKSNIKNKENELIFHEYFSDELKDLLLKLLNKNPYKRIGLSNKDELKNHPWFKDIDWDKLSRKGINSPLNLVVMKKEIEENYNYIINEEKDENIINNENIITNKKSDEKISHNKPSQFFQFNNRKDNNII